MRNMEISQIIGPIILIILSTSSLSTSALTTFGKSNPVPQPQTPSPPVHGGNARECRIDSDCTAIQNTTCMPDRPRDGKTRCLCGDYSAPDNGRCRNKGKAVQVPCNDDVECQDGAECIVKSNDPNKKCNCKENYWEENFTCNGAETIFRSSIIAIIGLAFLFVETVRS